MIKSIISKVAVKVNELVSPKPFATYIPYNEVKRINEEPRFTVGNANLLNKTITYSDGPGFLHSVEEIIIDGCYHFVSSNPRPLIIDCGSNIGLSIIYFKKLFPQATIIAFEPDKEIFSLLQKNIAAYGFKDVALHNKGVWTKNDTLTFYTEGSLSGSFVADATGGEQVITVETLRLKDFLNQQVDFLKIDIEGSENEIFPDLLPELINVKNLFVEYHSIRGKDQKLQQILDVMTAAGFRYYIKEATHPRKYPFQDHGDGIFDLQLNIFGYRS